jgi:hypothetical protein
MDPISMTVLARKVRATPTDLQARAEPFVILTPIIEAPFIRTSNSGLRQFRLIMMIDGVQTQESLEWPSSPR